MVKCITFLYKPIYTGHTSKLSLAAMLIYKKEYMPDSQISFGRNPVGGVQMAEPQLKDTQLEASPMADSHMALIGRQKRVQNRCTR